MCKIYGLSGPQGTYQGLWCLMPRQDMHKPGNQYLWSLETKLADNSNFITDSSAKKEVAKYHNALHTPLLNIQLDSVSPPYLHILLGIVLKHHKLLEDTAHMLDTNSQSKKWVSDAFGWECENIWIPLVSVTRTQKQTPNWGGLLSI